jgi:hypothetical protein
VGTLGSVASEWKPADESDERMLQRLLLLKDAAQGLKLLHSMNTVHGDLVGLQLCFNYCCSQCKHHCVVGWLSGCLMLLHSMNTVHGDLVGLQLFVY